MKPLKMEMIIIFWYYQIFIFISIYLPYRDVDPLNQIEEILVKSMAKYFTADADHYSRFFRWEIRKRYSFTWFSSRATSFDAHIEKRKGEKEWSLWKTNELNLYANALIFYLEYEQSMDACRDPVVVAVSTPMHNERAAGYRDI